MTSEINITPEETPAERELADAYRNWDVVHPQYLRNEIDKAEDDAAWARREAAEEAVKREKEAKRASGDERQND